jgi:predicted HNH restriction endonuclease
MAVKAKRKSTKKPITPKSLIRNALRGLWLRSRERSTALKRTEYRCSKCGAKQSKAKGREVLVEVHHAEHEPDWDRIFTAIYEELLQPSDRLMPVCVACHDKLHEKDGDKP